MSADSSAFKQHGLSSMLVSSFFVSEAKDIVLHPPISMNAFVCTLYFFAVFRGLARKAPRNAWVISSNHLIQELCYLYGVMPDDVIFIGDNLIVDNFKPHFTECLKIIVYRFCQFFCI